VVAIFVNGVDVRSIVQKAAGQDEARIDHALLPSDVVSSLWCRSTPAALARVRTGRSGRGVPWRGPDGRVAVLTCSCGDFGCGDFGCGDFGCGGGVARVELGEEVVTWSDFSHPSATAMLAMGPFRFDRDACERSLAAAVAP